MRDDKASSKGPGSKGPGSKAKDARAARLAEQLRANLQKRKAQSRARRAGEGDSRPAGIRAAGKPER
jgi:hypothetical protein